ncbi:hypothetical protein CB1_000227009 [Camelus ferus]|nr:hypothetical protein CB1_000227009 [Camelus ferus]
MVVGLPVAPLPESVVKDDSALNLRLSVTPGTTDVPLGSVLADTEDVCIVERLFSSSLVAIVSLKAPRKLKVCHFKKGTEICNYSYSNTILAVRLNRQRLIVCLEESLYIHNIRDMKVLHTIRETPPNPAGLCALSISNEHCYLAYPGSATIGEVQVFDTINLRAANMIPAHDSPLAALAFDASGTKLATASEKTAPPLPGISWGSRSFSWPVPPAERGACPSGTRCLVGTVIRVFSIPEGQKLFEFRRGVKRCVSICSLAFSMDGMFLSASSNTETVHIFKLETVKEKPQEEPTTWTGYFGKVLMASTSYLPSQVTEMFNQGRAFATVRLPFCGHKNICALATIQKIPRLLVGASDGYLYMYNLDPQEGGECTLMKQHKLDGSGETTNEILDSTSHDCPLVTQAHSTAAAKGAHVPSSPTTLGKGGDASPEAYADELGAAGGVCLEDEASALRLEEDKPKRQGPHLIRASLRSSHFELLRTPALRPVDGEGVGAKQCVSPSVCESPGVTGERGEDDKNKNADTGNLAISGRHKVAVNEDGPRGALGSPHLWAPRPAP